MRLNLKNFHGKTTNTSELIDRVGLMDENELVKILDNVTFIDQVTVAVYVREIFDRLFVLLGNNNNNNNRNNNNTNSNRNNNNNNYNNNNTNNNNNNK